MKYFRITHAEFRSAQFTTTRNIKLVAIINMPPKKNKNSNSKEAEKNYNDGQIALTRKLLEYFYCPILHQHISPNLGVTGPDGHFYHGKSARKIKLDSFNRWESPLTRTRFRCKSYNCLSPPSMLIKQLFEELKNKNVLTEMEFLMEEDPEDSSSSQEQQSSLSVDVDNINRNFIRSNSPSSPYSPNSPSSPYSPAPGFYSNVSSPTRAYSPRRGFYRIDSDSA